MYSWRRRLILEQNLRYAEKMIEEMQQKASPLHSPAERESDSPAEGSQEEDSEASDAFIERLSRVILANLGNENLDIDLLTDFMAMSRSTLYRRVKATLGMSANEYIRWVRIGEAARRIRSGELNEQTIAAIAADCGFNNLRYFRTCFKKRYGVTPSEYGEQKRS
jgi:AraC-like DNA-binding protein